MVVKITDTKAKEEILNTQFHQVFHISLTNPFISEDINNDWYNNWYKEQDDETNVFQYLHSITIENDYLEDKEPSNIEGKCVRVISGDTLVLETGEYISIAGVKAPNINTDAGIAVKEAVEGACLNQHIRLRFDPNCKYDNNNKLLCMVAFDTTKSLNKLLLKNKLCKYVTPVSQILAQELKSESTLCENTLSNTSEYLDHQFVNVTIPLEKICNIETSYGIGSIYNSFNNDFTNILITNINDYSVIHQCEIYQDVLFIRLQPYVDTIALHILPKTYNTSDDLLLVRDITEGWQKDFSQDYYNMHNDERKNLYFQMQKSDGEIVDRSGREEDGYPEFSNLIDSSHMYYRLDNTNRWLEDPYTKTFGEISYPISDYALTNVQINVGYKYNESSPCNAVHYTGTKDMTNIDCKDRLTLIDCNLDHITSNTNVISRLQCVDNQLIFPTDVDILVNDGFTNSTGLHSINDNIGRLYHKTIKYYNDDMYSEEFDGQNTHYMFSEYEESILYIDTVETDNTSKYGITHIPGSVNKSITYNSSNQSYTIQNLSSGFCGLSISNINNLINFDITMEFEITVNQPLNAQIGLGVYDAKKDVFITSRYESVGEHFTIYSNDSKPSFIDMSQPLNNNTYYTMQFIKHGNEYTLKIYNINGTLLNESTGESDVFDDTSLLTPFIYFGYNRGSTFNIRNIKVMNFVEYKCYNIDSLTIDKQKYTLTKGSGNCIYTQNGIKIEGTTEEDTFWYSPDDFLPSQDYIIEIDVIDWGDSQFTSDFGVEGLFFSLQPRNRKLSLFYLQNDIWKVLSDISNQDFVKGKTFKLEVSGDSTKTIKVYYDNNLLYTAEDIQQTRKQFFKTYKNRLAVFKNLKIYKKRG